jgi:diacylglycerol O-acyltransferase / wax synthase
MQQLSGVDTSFLSMETPTTYAHVCNVVVFDRRDGEVLTLDAVRDLVRQRIHLLPAFRNRLVEVPFGVDRPYWIVDPEFDLDYHLRELALPPPGSDAQLRAQVARIAERPLDRARPLWEIYVITGLAGGRTVLMLKFHHAAVDGIAGREILTTLLDPSPEPRAVAPPAPTEPEPVPSDAEVLLRGVASLATSPVRLLQLQRRMWANLPNALRFSRSAEGSDVTRWLQRAGRPRDGALLAPPPMGAPRTSFNRPIGRHRRWTFGTAPLAEAKALKRVAGVTVNDVVLTMCAGGLRRWLLERDELPDRPLLVSVPVSVRTDTQRDHIGNRVSSLIAPLPTHEPDPAERLQRTHEAMRVAKEQHAAIGADVLADFTQFAMPALAARAARVAASMRIADYLNPPFNLVVSNVPGAQQPLFLAGAQMQHTYPVSLVTDGLGLNITVQSYLGHLDFGLIADRDLVPDLDTLTGLVLEELAVLRAAHPGS